MSDSQSMFQKLRSNPLITGPIAAIVILVSGFVIWQSIETTPRHSDQNWFYDLNTGELFAVPAGTTPPIDTDSGKNAGVFAAVVRGEGGNENHILYLRTMIQLDDGTTLGLIAIPDQMEWHNESSTKAMSELFRSQQQIAGQYDSPKLTRVQPGD